MLESKAAAGLSALGNPTRLAIFRLLVQVGEQGCPIGVIGQRIDIPLSTLAHHLSALARADLIGQEKAGREVICTANYDRLNSLMDYLKANCCGGAPDGETRSRPIVAADEVLS